ncbi:minor capsid protein [Latilactobacillus curvatus]
MGRNDYWFKREQKWIKQQLKDDALINKKIELQLNRALVNIQKDIANYYAAYAKSQNISLADAMTKVKQFDVKAFETTAKQMVENKDFSALANERLKLYNATMRINQLEYLKSQVGMELVDANSNIEKIMGDKLTSAYQDEVKRQAGILNKHRLNDVKGAVNSVVNASFQGATWSQRIWANNDNLKSRLEQLLTRSMVQGINPKVLARDLSDQFKKEFNNSRYMAERLMRTETARVQDEAQRRSFEKNGIEYVVWVNEPDACENCIDIANANDGIYPLNKVPGIPVHANCRCSKAAYVPDAETKDNIKEAMDKIDLSTASYEDLVNLGAMFNKENGVDDILGNKDALTKAFAKYRDMGGKIPDSAWYTKSNRSIKEELRNSFSHYPKQWAEYVTQNNKKFFAGKNKSRGFFQKELVTASGKRLLPGVAQGDGVSIYSTGERATTAWHEIGHMVDYFNPNLVRLEKEFVDARTKGEMEVRLKSLFPNSRYGPRERIKKDDFISPYIGKYYSNGTEVLSMGLESVFEPGEGQIQALGNGKYVRRLITSDPEYLNLIIGIILKG